MSAAAYLDLMRLTDRDRALCDVWSYYPHDGPDGTALVFRRTDWAWPGVVVGAHIRIVARPLAGLLPARCGASGT